MMPPLWAFVVSLAAPQRFPATPTRLGASLEHREDLVDAAFEKSAESDVDSLR
jgi:hypothetical protein